MVASKTERYLFCHTKEQKYKFGDSVIIKYFDEQKMRSVVLRGIILKIGTVYVRIRTSAYHVNHRKTSWWSCSKQIKIDNISMIKNIKNNIDV